MNELQKNIEDYLNGVMTPKEIAVFEEQIQNDPNLKKDIEAYKEMAIIYDDKDWELTDSKTTNPKVLEYETFLKSDTAEEIVKNFKTAEQHYFTKKAPLNIKKLLIYTGSIAAIFSIIFFSIYPPNKNYTNPELAEKYKDWSDLPSFGTKGSENNNLIQAEKLFIKENYEEALINFNQLKTDNTNKDLTSLYIGISQLEIGQNQNAIQTFTKLTNHWKYGSRAKWYLALAYLTIDNSGKAKKVLESIAENPGSFNHKKAKELLDKIK